MDVLVLIQASTCSDAWKIKDMYPCGAPIAIYTSVNARTQEDGKLVVAV
jgi:hypothetical protein